jgi:putative FmdB family regulatory protein
MPIYEYACACGKTFEELIVRKSDEAEVACPACRGRRVSRVLSRTASPRTGGGGGGFSPGPSCGPVG